MLIGGAGNDSYSFNTNTARGSDTVQEASGEGTDTLNFTGSTAAVVVDLGVAGAAQVVNANLTLTLASAEVENATGGSGNDTLTGNAANNVLTGGSGTDTRDSDGRRRPDVDEHAADRAGDRHAEQHRACDADRRCGGQLAECLGLHRRACHPEWPGRERCPPGRQRRGCTRRRQRGRSPHRRIRQ